ncbi:MAG: hypothetical protein MJ068_04595 [Clostridia bacterium]|nr:hypothetical protein [Clostridia bacterium]
MVLFFVRGDVDSDRYISFCYENYRNLYPEGLPEKCTIIRENGKKPRLDTDMVEFNLSHSSGVCVVAMSSAPVGIDIEKIRDIDYNKFNFIKADSREDFFEKWTERESYLKYTGKGLSDLRCEIPPETHFEHFPVFGEYHVCVCAEEQDIRAFEMDINALKGD